MLNRPPLSCPTPKLDETSYAVLLPLCCQHCFTSHYSPTLKRPLTTIVASMNTEYAAENGFDRHLCDQIDDSMTQHLSSYVAHPHEVSDTISNDVRKRELNLLNRDYYLNLKEPMERWIRGVYGCVDPEKERCFDVAC